MMMPVVAGARAVAVAGVGFAVVVFAGAERGRDGVLRLVRVCAWTMNGSVAASVVRTIVLRNKYYLPSFVVCAGNSVKCEHQVSLKNNFEIRISKSKFSINTFRV